MLTLAPSFQANDWIISELIKLKSLLHVNGFIGVKSTMLIEFCFFCSLDFFKYYSKVSTLIAERENDKKIEAIVEPPSLYSILPCV